MNTPVDQLNRLCSQYDIVLLYAFGSRGQSASQFLSTGEPMPPGESDLDVGILTGRPLSVGEKAVFSLALETLFGVPRVDLVILSAADPFLTANIIRGERLFARDAYQADEYELYILRRAGDLAPFERQRLDLILRK
jgi:hypothetical protein